MDDRRRPTARMTLAALLGVAATPSLPFEPVLWRRRSAAGRRSGETAAAKRARQLARKNRKRNAARRRSGQ